MYNPRASLYGKFGTSGGHQLDIVGRHSRLRLVILQDLEHVVIADFDDYPRGPVPHQWVSHARPHDDTAPPDSELAPGDGAPQRDGLVGFVETHKDLELHDAPHLGESVTLDLLVLRSPRLVDEAVYPVQLLLAFRQRELVHQPHLLPHDSSLL